jgi:hypothetical protein
MLENMLPFCAMKIIHAAIKKICLNFNFIFFADVLLLI